ncbi:lysine 6-monooxygenase [Salibacterium salarium]|uniref:L-lysine N6-monooxygenase MbtG n=1 Tax=Salibacterium salarium TaxID=284579 RepID=A0A428MUB2_9BACI|nr:lysine N(6)-hydroxylase/L-ornithine N(5)-oxygenase family protein [Salibacterium salarium]RSL29722.1 lysine 6-monooxygenase [Salibacterium salarium]
MIDSTNHSNPIYDVIGIGIGPFNLGLAALLDSVSEVQSLFLEKEKEFNWHPDMLIEGTTLQVPFLADLVSMVDVKSSYSFLNYLQEHNRLYHFYFLEKFHIPRKEYNHYCRWVSEQLKPCRFGMNVQKVNPIEQQSGQIIYEVTAWNEQTEAFEQYLTKHIVIGIGSIPSVPEHLKDHLGSSVFHTADYLSNIETCREANSIAVIGSGQSAAEVFIDIAKNQQDRDVSLQWYTRSKGFFPMEYSKLGLEYFSPEYIDFFYELPQIKKDKLLKDQDLLYKGISADTIGEIYDYLYESSIGNEYPDIHLQAMTEIINLEKKEDSVRLVGYHHVNEEYFEVEADLIVLGTGYKSKLPDFLNDMKEWMDLDDYGRHKVKKGYGLEIDLSTDSEIFVQNGEFHTHGVGAPDLGLGAHRNAVIINQIAGRDVYPLHSKHVFQTFGIHKKTEKTLSNAFSND